jgi:hypothetical protein
MTLNNGADGDLCGVSLSDGSRFSNWWLSWKYDA